MLLTAADVPPRGPGWSFEVKWDGYRAGIAIAGGRVSIASRRGVDLTDHFPELAHLAATVREDVLFDGEIVVIGDDGYSDFDALAARWPRGRERRATYVVFDVLERGGVAVVHQALHQRRLHIEELVPEDIPALLVRSRSFTDGDALFAEATARGLEGVVGKADAGVYEAGRRSRSWVKSLTATGREVQRLRALRFARG
jgi:bifunctional non-homologous end joining protein LigD